MARIYTALTARPLPPPLLRRARNLGIVQRVQKAATLQSQRKEARHIIRETVQAMLVTAADDDTAQMVWTPQAHSTTQPTILGWGVELCGWPPSIPWQCPGHICSLRQLQDIVKALYRGEIFFRRLRPVEICRYARELEVEPPVARPLRPVESRAKRLFRSAGVQTDEGVGDWSADLKV